MKPVEKELICVTCPRGCRLRVLMDGDKVLEVLGNNCKRGASYAEIELRDPRRMVASTVRVCNGERPVLPVTLSAPIQKRLIRQLLREISTVTIEAPVKMGDVIIQNVLNSGVNVVASRNLKTAGKTH
jgi:CxxC motif-containing protein